MRRHVSAEVLALHREGAVSPRRAGRITAHLAVCRICAGVDADLGAVTSLLPATRLRPMPQVYVERIQFAIASEAALRADTSTAAVIAAGAAEAVGTDVSRIADAGDAGEAAHIPGRPDLPEPGRGRSRRPRMPNWSSPLLLRGLAAAGAVVIIAGAGALFIRGHTNTSGGAASGTGAPAPLDGRQHAAQRPSAVNGSGAAVSGVNKPVSMTYRLNGRIATARALTSGRDYTRQNMIPLVRKDVASAALFGQNKAAGTYPRAASPGAMFGGIRVLKLMGCLTRLAAGRSIVVADVARYLGRPATIVVMRSSPSAHELNVAVVRVTCSLASPEIIARVTVPAR